MLVWVTFFNMKFSPLNILPCLSIPNSADNVLDFTRPLRDNALHLLVPFCGCQIHTTRSSQKFGHTLPGNGLSLFSLISTLWIDVRDFKYIGNWIYVTFVMSHKFYLRLLCVLFIVLILLVKIDAKRHGNERKTIAWKEEFKLDW